MTKRIVIASQKGGQAKTTSTVILSSILASIGYKVLVVDFDAQGNTTSMMTGESIYKYSGRTTMEAIRENSAAEYILELSENLHLLPAEDMVATFPNFIYTQYSGNPLQALKNTLAPIEGQYDFVFVDLPPSLGDSVINAIVYADYIVVPADYGAFGMDALDRYIEFVDASRDEGHTKAEILGIVMVMKSARSNHEKGIRKLIQDSYSDLVFNTEIRRRSKIKEYAMLGVDLQHESIEDYMNFALEFIERINQKEKLNNEQ